MAGPNAGSEAIYAGAPAAEPAAEPAAAPADAGAPAAPAPSEGDGTSTGTQQPPPAPTEAPPRQDTFMPIILMVGVVLLFYFMIMRPQKKREQARRDMIGKLKTGNKVITASGIIGEVVELSDQDVVIKIDPRKDVRMRVRRAAIAGLAGDPASEESAGGGAA
ncbi:MAG: preprotein translocase subunit YajC [Planctomycetota bacterium]|jgi:preprotein translocase subunit YajC